MNINNYIAKGAPKRTGQELFANRKCIVCNKPISKDDTPQHLFYSKFCSENCKQEYMER